MKTILKYTIRFTLLAVMFLCVSCEDMFKDPLKDKETGNDITVLLLDRNFIDTKLLLWFVDAETDEPIEDQYIELRIWGDNAERLITFAGEKPDVFSTEIGFLELAYDPNYKVSESDPLAITIMAVGESSISVPRFLSYTRDGIKDVVIRMNKKEPGKPFKVDPFREPYDISYNGILNSSDLNYLANISGQATGTAYDYINLYYTLAAGGLVCDNLQEEILYDDYGVYFTSNQSGSLVPPANPAKELQLSAGDYVFSSILKSGIEKCGTGLTLQVSRADGDPGTGTFEYLTSFSDGSTMSGQISGTFPMEHYIEPIYYPEADPAVTVELFGDAQYAVASGPVSLSTACGGTAAFAVNPHENLRTYKFINQYICPDNPVGFALSINGQFRRSGVEEPWSSFEFVEGVCELELEEGAEYDIRVALDGEYYNYTLPTDPNELEQFIKDKEGEDYTIVELEITPLEDKTEVFAILEVSEDVCTSLSGG